MPKRFRIGKPLFRERISELVDRISKNQTELKRIRFREVPMKKYRTLLLEEMSRDKILLKVAREKRKSGWRSKLRILFSPLAYRRLARMQNSKIPTAEEYRSAKDKLHRLDLLELLRQKKFLSEREWGELIDLTREKALLRRVIKNVERRRKGIKN